VSGPLEAHLTVAPPSGEVGRLSAWAEDRGLGFTHIVLARGEVPSQPMLNLPGHGSAAAHQRAADAVTAELAADGFRVVRIKTEASPWADGVPADDLQAAAHGPDRYFEHHVKVLHAAGADPSLAARVTPYDAHLSWNARRRRDDGRAERFVTQRCHGVGRDTAERRLAALLAELRGLPILEVEREFVVHDTALELDTGWLPQPSRAAANGGTR
jgi:hypothetical protein